MACVLSAFQTPFKWKQYDESVQDAVADPVRLFPMIVRSKAVQGLVPVWRGPHRVAILYGG
jgi:hypothetical protein